MNMIRKFWKDEDGIGVVEIVLILVILVALIVIFKDKITSIISSAFSQIDDGTGTINDGIRIKGRWKYHDIYDVYFSTVVCADRSYIGQCPLF